ncbi:hypothetical protein GOBAR_AA03125 [Gossypium barbadense]|uniref:DUF4283 domain-containing protein n=1 Tax=Gossypium barbadense TaxID=3634 RepID=A0A2P5YPB5_GOSBA|nr:hypothetical protein GOBAR_AA03125 [Gossypium barbadense]
MSWIRLSGLPSYMYERKILVEIGGMIGNVAKMDMNTDNRLLGLFCLPSCQLIDSEPSKGLRENNKNLRPSGLLGAKALSLMDRAMEGLKKHNYIVITNDVGCLDENGGLDSSGNNLVTENGGVNLNSFFALKSVMEGTVDIVALVMVGGLDLSRHTVVTFKENNDPNTNVYVEGVLGWSRRRTWVIQLERELEIV